jgi:hypothetical protein
MLGFHPLLQRTLRKKGRRAFATIVSAERTHLLNTAGDPSVVSNTTRMWKVVLHVEPEGEPPFEAKLDAWFGQMDDPRAQEQYVVLYDPGDHTKVVIDNSDEGVQMLVNHTVTERAEKTIDNMRAHGQNEMARRYQQVVDDGLLTDYSNNPIELRKQIRERRTKIKEIMAGQTEQDRVNQIRDAGSTYDQQKQEIMKALGPTMIVGGQVMTPTGANDAAATADALSKLADLHDRGVLSDAEFDAQKKKLLGE